MVNIIFRGKSHAGLAVGEMACFYVESNPLPAHLMQDGNCLVQDGEEKDAAARA